MVTNAGGILRRLILPIRDFIYPPICCTCGRLLAEEEATVCRTCWDRCTRVDASHPVWLEIRDKICATGIIRDLRSCYLFEKEGTLQQVIHVLKYQGMRWIGEKLGNQLGERIAADPIFRDIDYLVPVPLHRLKERERGYNQSAIICRGIAAAVPGMTTAAVLMRTRFTGSQTRLSLEQRTQNVAGAFAVSHRSRATITGKSFLLVDDVITTGSTIIECGRCLRASGASDVYAASIALAQ